MHAHAQFRPGSIRPEGFQDEMGEVLSDLVRTDNALSRSLFLIPDLILTEERIDQTLHIGVLRPVVTLEGSAGQHSQILVFLYVVLLVPYQICAQAVTGDHKILSDKSSERGLI